VRDEERSLESEQKSREHSFIRELVPNWRTIRDKVLRSVRITIVASIALLGVLLLLYVIGFLVGVTLWNVLKVLAVPITVGAAVPLLNWLQKKRELELAEQRAKADREGAEQRAQDEALQAYLDQMSTLLADKDRPLRRAATGDNLSTLARARTLTVLTRLGGERKRSILQFVSESGLIKGQKPVVSLIEADLSRAHLYGANWRKVNLSETRLNRTDLSGSDLSFACLYKAYLYKANLLNANLSGANLSRAILVSVDLGGANLNGANLSGAILAPAIGDRMIQEDQLPDTLKRKLEEKTLGPDELERATILITMGNVGQFRADLWGANLSGANLSGARGITNEELERQAKSLECATMPNGQKYEDWLKSKENGKNE
jgi:hypothetical protein